MTRAQADLIIDLHGLLGTRAEYRVEQLLEDRNNQGKTILFIHGGGQGILRDIVRSKAAEARQVKNIWPGEDYFLDGGAGVTLVFL